MQSMLTCDYGKPILQALAYCYIIVIEVSNNLGKLLHVSLRMERDFIPSTLVVYVHTFAEHPG